MASLTGPHDSTGFTLVETLLALLVVSMGILAIAPMFAYSMQTNSAGADLGIVGAIAVEQMEIIRRTPYPDLVPGGDLQSDLVGYSDTSNPGVTVRWTVSDNVTPSASRTITLRSTASGKHPREITLITIRAK